MFTNGSVLGIFEKGGPIMWPLLAVSVTAVSVTVERLLFLVAERRSRNPKLVGQILDAAAKNDIGSAVRLGESSGDFIARTLAHGLRHAPDGFSNALLRQATQELKRFGKGLPTLDTIITLAPLLGLLGTVTGMIRAFGLLGANELEAPAAITGGIAEALIATAFGLGVAIVALIPFNYLNTQLEEARHEVEDASTRLEMVLTNARTKT